MISKPRKTELESETKWNVTDVPDDVMFFSSGSFPHKGSLLMVAAEVDDPSCALKTSVQVLPNLSSNCKIRGDEG
jgi:hypothetical protein